MQQSLKTQCRCNGVSGACTLKICWSTLPPFRVIGDNLYARYRDRARRVAPVLADRSASPQRLRLCRRASEQGHDKSNVKKPRRSDLVYTVPSPDYCDHDPESGTPGTAGRQCRLHGDSSSSSEGTCEHLCCGRGHTTEQYPRIWRCHCKFHWCCRVTCRQCTELADRLTCNDGAAQMSSSPSPQATEPCL